MPKLRTAVTVVVTVLTTTLAGMTAAFAQVPPADPMSGSMTTPGPASTHAGSPIWVFVLVAGITMAVTAAVTLLAAQRLRPRSAPVTRVA